MNNIRINIKSQFGDNPQEYNFKLAPKFNKALVEFIEKHIEKDNNSENLRRNLIGNEIKLNKLIEKAKEVSGAKKVEDMYQLSRGIANYNMAFVGEKKYTYVNVHLIEDEDKWMKWKTEDEIALMWDYKSETWKKIKLLAKKYEALE